MILALAFLVLGVLGGPVAALPRQETPKMAPAQKISERITLPRERRPLYMEITLASEDPETPLLLLLHEARSSMGEYRPIVPRLKELGYNCLAVDLSSGARCLDVVNSTNKIQVKTGRNPTYLDSLPDVLDAVLWAREHHAHGKLLAIGSGYSASLALVVAAEHPDLIEGVAAFAPGEYFTALGKSATWVQDTARGVIAPVLVIGPRASEPDWKGILEAIPEEHRNVLLCEDPGVRGARALWPESPGSAEAWSALEAFLARCAPPLSPEPAKEER